MSGSIARPEVARESRSTNPVCSCGGAEIRACSRHLATVVAIRGDITAANLDAVITQATRFLLPDTSFVLDLSELESIAPQGAELLCAIDDACAVADVEWAVVTGPATNELLDAELRDRMLPIVDSVADALHDFADAITSQRSLLLPLLRHSA